MKRGKIKHILLNFEKSKEIVKNIEDFKRIYQQQLKEVKKQQSFL